MKEKIYDISESGKKKLDSILKNVLHDVKPSKKEIDESKFAVNMIMSRLKQHAPKDVEILLAGSVARGTQIKGNSDIDIFLLFPRKMKETVIEKKGLEIAKKIVNKKNNETYIVKYAEHPYTRLILNDLMINVDIVPAYKIINAKQMGTAVDRTQLHNEFVNDNLNEKQRDDVRLLKAFLKSHRIYGAEAKVEGFSGYLCELLVYNYGSFVKVITAIANAKLPVVLNTGKSRATNIESTDFMLKLFNKRFIVVDPTDSNRNVAANVSDESLARFMVISRMLLKLPSNEAFYGPKISHDNPEKRIGQIRDSLGSNLYVIHFRVPDIANEIIWQQLKKTRLRLGELLKHSGFDPIISIQNVKDRDAVIGLFIGNIEIGSRKVVGPSVEMGDAVERFLNSHRNSVLSMENERVYAIEKADFRKPGELIASFLKNKATKLPSNLKANESKLYTNTIPENEASLVYAAYSEKFSL